MGGREIWIAGFPSAYGGADTELGHQIDLFLQNGAEVHLVPMFAAKPCEVKRALARGCAVHEFHNGIFRDRVVMSWCNGNFLESLPAIVYAGRPAAVVWFNCMTRLFPREQEAHDRGWIDYFGFASSYQQAILVAALEAIRPVRSFRYRPYFNWGKVAWGYREWNGSYRIGRISRDDSAKFAHDTWKIFSDVATPAGLAKEVWILGYGRNAAARIGEPPAGLACRLWGPGSVAAESFLGGLDTMIHKTGGSRESYCRVLVEAYAHGVVPIVERDYAFPELVVQGETGFMTSDSAEMSAHASRLAHDPERHRRMARNGREHLEMMCQPEACWKGWEELLGKI